MFSHFFHHVMHSFRFETEHAVHLSLDLVEVAFHVLHVVHAVA